MEKFGDMPGWEERLAGESIALHPEAIGLEIVKPEIEPEPEIELQLIAKDLPRLYQVLEVNGRPFSRPSTQKSNSKFWNEGRWETFIAPLLPEDCTDQALVEMGCNAGLFLKMAKDRGYRHVVGIEKNTTPAKWANKFRDAIGYDYIVLKRSLGGKFGGLGTFDIDELPVADVILMSTFHYYIDINAWVKFLDRLKTKTCYTLIVSRPELKEEHWRAKASYAAAADYFRDWQEVGRIENVSTEGDPAPRDLYSVMFKSPLIRRVPIEDIDIRERPDDPMYMAMMDLAERIADSGEFDLHETDYYKRWEERKGRWSIKTLRRFVGMKFDVMKSVRDDGLRDPIIVQRDGLKLSDGGHRLVMLRALGYKSVIVREV